MDIEIYLAILFIPVAVGVLTTLLPIPMVWKKKIPIALCCVSCIAGIFAYPIFISCDLSGYSFPLHSAWGDYTILLSDLSAIMLSFSSLVFFAVIAHMSRSVSAPKNARYYALTCLMFIVCALTICADSVILILLGWEMITLLTFLMSSCKNEGARWRFLVITHFGGLMIIAAFIIMLIHAGTPILSSWSNLHLSMGLPMSCAVIILLFAGFGTKLGLIPFHVWIPDLYDSAPTHTTTILTTVCSNVAILILFRSVFDYIGMCEGMHIIAIGLIVISSITMIWGALESIIQTEAKRILAYSSMENMALVVLCFSVGILFSSNGYTGLTVMILAAGILHTINHSVFKALMLMTVGTVEDSTGTTSMDRLGGLAKVLPLLSAVGLIAVLSMAAIPPFSGFMSEWLMLQSVMNGDVAGIGEMELILPIVVAVLGISGMLAAVSYARMYGFIFLGRPRSDVVRKCERTSKTTLAPMMVLASACIALGVFAIPLIGALADGIYSSDSFLPTDPYENYLMSSLDLPLLTLLIVLMIAVIYGLNRTFRKKVSKDDTWGCGVDLEENMQYTSSGFTQPLVKVFHPLYGDVAVVADDVEHHKHFTLKFKEPFVTYLYEPLGKFMLSFSKIFGKMQNGNIQTYLGYILVTLVVTLAAVRLL